MIVKEGMYVYWQFWIKYGKALVWTQTGKSVVKTKISKYYGISPYSVITCQKSRHVVVDKVKKDNDIDVAIPGDTRVCDKEQEKIEKDSLLNNEIGRSWQIKKVIVIPIIVGVLRTISAKFEKYIESLEIEITIWTCSEIRIVKNSQNNKKVTILLSTQEGILLWDLWPMSALTVKTRDTEIRSTRDSIGINKAQNNKITMQ